VRDLSAKFTDLGVEGIGSSPAEFAAVIKSEIPRWAKVIKDAEIKAEKCINAYAVAARKRTAAK